MSATVIPTEMYSVDTVYLLLGLGALVAGGVVAQVIRVTSMFSSGSGPAAKGKVG